MYVFLKSRDSCSSPYCNEEQTSTVQISELTRFFGVFFSPFSVWIMGFDRSWSAGTNLGIWSWVTKSLSKGLLPPHMPPSHFFQLPNLQLEEVPMKWLCLWQAILFIDFCQGLVTENLFRPFFPFGGRTETIGEKASSPWRAFSQLLQLLWPDITCYHLPPLQMFLLKKKQNTTESVRATDWN